MDFDVRPDGGVSERLVSCPTAHPGMAIRKEAGPHDPGRLERIPPRSMESRPRDFTWQIVDRPWPRTSARPITKNEIHVWRADLDSQQVDHREIRHILSHAEIDRALRIRRKAAGSRFLSAAVVRRDILATYLGCAPGDLTFDRTCRWCGHPTHGKPRIAAPATPLTFSSTTSENLFLVAVSPGAAVGVDIEEIRSAAEVAPIVAAYLSDGYARSLVEAAPDRTREVYRLWVAYEAHAKAVELGVAADFRRVLDRALTQRGRLRTTLMTPRPGFAAAVVHSAGAIIRTFSWET